ncbi:alpha/beta hydrolase [Pleurocapsales cyanobacterium LEGE 06147]|nr:alpha/beta hydrolase [Pleurocapsales cyanobacterium LEGE 06147]
MNQIRFLVPQPAKPKPDFPLFVYLPGMDCTGKLFQTQAKRLAHFFDLRCLSIPTDDLSDWNELAGETVKLLKNEIAINQRRSVYLCGESFGGCLALKVAMRAPWSIQRLILVNPASSFNHRPWLGWGVRIIQWLPSVLHHYSAVGLLPFLAELSRIAQNDYRALLRAMNSVPQQVVSWRLSLLRDFEPDEESLRRLTQPTLVVAGGADRLLPSVAEAQRLVKILPQAQMKILPLSGHACLLESETNLYNILAEYNFLPLKIAEPLGEKAV